MQELFDVAYHQAKQGPPPAARESESSSRAADDICSIDPGACQWRKSPCPSFLGDPWSGVRAKREERPDSEPDVAPAEASPP